MIDAISHGLLSRWSRGRWAALSHNSFYWQIFAIERGHELPLNVALLADARGFLITGRNHHVAGFGGADWQPKCAPKAAAKVNLHVFVSGSGSQAGSRQSPGVGDRLEIRERLVLPTDRIGAALNRGFKAAGLHADDFHQELLEMR